MKTHHELMQIALEEAELALEAGEIPVGAILVKDDEVIARGHNRRVETGDPTAHAEVLVLQMAGKRTGDWRLEGATLYVTLEPCPMCAGAIALARIERVVFGASEPRAGAGGSAYNLLEDGRLGHRVQVIAGVMEEECGRLLQGFFDDLR
ncbi:MAG: tRNA adenosine(34) deaminase TadA [Actinobacteria bacterium]|nr:tRNA adenosine(34) deaminase TadA [Actinomycetota bacterium]